MAALLPFRDREEAGRHLALLLERQPERDPIVVALPRGGVPVALEVARALPAPLDIVVVRKLGAPQQPELGVGAIAEDDTVVLDRGTIGDLGISPEQLNAVITRESAELHRRRAAYRRSHPQASVRDRTVILVDDGMARGLTAAAAARALRGRGARRIVLAVPVCPPGAEDRIGAEVDRFVCVAAPPGFGSVGAYYRDFSPTSDEEVIATLRASRRITPAADGPLRREVVIPAPPDRRLRGDLVVPPGARGLVIFGHGSGSSRHSPRNVEVAATLNARGLATLLFDLLTPDEATDRRNVFDIGLLGSRLAQAVSWAEGSDAVRGLPVGLFGASTGAAAALRAAASHPQAVRAVVSRGGRPDLAGDVLGAVAAPTLLIVGGADHEVLRLNRAAARRLRGRAAVEVVPGAGHLFEEPGALAAVAQLAADWFAQHLAAEPATAPASGLGVR
jgi:putative phosphoribosyl transferase